MSDKNQADTVKAILDGNHSVLTSDNGIPDSLGQDGIEEAAIILNISKAIQKREYADALHALKALDMESQRIIRGFYSRNVLHNRELEWTGHGINRTFRFWSEEKKADYLRFTNRVLDHLDKRYDVSLGYGSVLSIIRDEDLIPHDDDLDIIVSVNADDIITYNQALHDMNAYLEEADFRIHGDYVAHRHASDGVFTVDIFLGLQDGDYVSWHPGPRNQLLYDDVFPPSEANLFGQDCWIPRDPDRYLEVVYGKDWRTPIAGWTHNFDPSPYADWFWPKAK